MSRLFTQAEVGPVCGTVRTPSSVAPDYREGWWKGDWRATGGAVPARVVVGTAGGAAELNVAGRSIQTTWLILVALEWSSGKERKGNDKPGLPATARTPLGIDQVLPSPLGFLFFPRPTLPRSLSTQCRPSTRSPRPATRSSPSGLSSARSCSPTWTRRRCLPKPRSGSGRCACFLTIVSTALTPSAELGLQHARWCVLRSLACKEPADEQDGHRQAQQRYLRVRHGRNPQGCAADRGGVPTRRHSGVVH